jgi:recombinational DNA repair protein RecR
MVKKNEVVERPVNEKRFCKKCEYYYSEFFTCPICYGEKRAEERIIKLLEAFDPRTAIGDLLPLLIKGENK